MVTRTSPRIPVGYGDVRWELAEAILPFGQGAPVTATVRYFFGGEDVDGKENVDRFLAESYRKPASGSVLALASLVIKPQALGLNRIDARTGGGNCRHLFQRVFASTQQDRQIDVDHDTDDIDDTGDQRSTHDRRVPANAFKCDW